MILPAFETAVAVAYFAIVCLICRSSWTQACAP